MIATQLFLPGAQYGRCLLMGLLAAGLACPVNADVYKYKDAHGNWQFSDKPPAAGEAEKLDRYATAKPRTAIDYQRELEQKYQPQSRIEAATIAVVKVETPLGSGSGFFLTRSGYLVTNKHVVRPPELSKADREGKLLESEAALRKARKSLSQQRSRLQRARRNLKEYTNYFNNLGEGEQRELQAELKRRKKDYATSKRNIATYAARIKSDTQQLADARNNYNRRHSNTMVAQQFIVRLKDDTRLNAALVGLSENYDLALLKVDGHSLPFLPVASAHRARQGQEVFAIGSPLGNTDYVTAGIITSLKRDRIVMDAQILPGNSGGPLLNAEGGVIGVNTWKMLSSNAMATDGFGVAIPAKRLLTEFADVLQRDARAGDLDSAAKSASVPAAEAARGNQNASVNSKKNGTANALRDAILRDYKAGQ